MTTPVRAARRTFAGYAALDAPHLPESEMSALQVKLVRWQNKNFKSSDVRDCVLGVCEEAGELSHAILKHHQGIRGMADREAYREAAGDAIADAMIYLIQTATHLRLDWWDLLRYTAEEVMQRDWTKKSREGI
jgi:NTP pyrophosphatase (non-canonical NTP hydrolase)